MLAPIDRVLRAQVGALLLLGSMSRPVLAAQDDDPAKAFIARRAGKQEARGPSSARWLATASRLGTISSSYRWFSALALLSRSLSATRLAGNGGAAKRIAWSGALLATAVSEAVGGLAAVVPTSWMLLFSTDGGVIAIGDSYLRWVAPFYGLFGLGVWRSISRRKERAA